MDFITDLPPSAKSGVKILLVILDRLNERVILILILWIFTSVVTIAFIKRYIPYHGFLKVIINDERIEFTNAVWAIIYEALGIECYLVLAYHPEINRATECVNEII